MCRRPPVHMRAVGGSVTLMRRLVRFLLVFRRVVIDSILDRFPAATLDLLFGPPDSKS
ncbi:hypothetical protein HYPGJ_20448 [Hyphomicrobium sp. GJ21]|nr:hypothetical protein HYPGJ_20448 [Hyphomicrobium sp. GJ21]